MIWQYGKSDSGGSVGGDGVLIAMVRIEIVVVLMGVGCSGLVV